MFFYVFGNAFSLIVCALALWKGGRDERIVTIAYLANLAASKLLLTSIWRQPEYALLAIDIAFLVVLTLLSLRTLRWWLLWCTAFQLLIVVIHVAMVVDPSVRPRSYATGFVIWSYMVLTALLVGTVQAWRERGGRRGATRPT